MKPDEALDLSMLLTLIYRDVFKKAIPFAAQEVEVPKPPVYVSAEVQIYKGEKLVVETNKKAVKKLFRKLRWETPPIVSLAYFEPMPTKFRVVAYVGYQQKHLTFRRKAFSFFKHLRFSLLGLHSSYRSFSFVEICPTNIWDHTHEEFLWDNEYRYRRKLHWVLAHELGHAWWHYKKHWSHEPPWLLRTIFAISRICTRPLRSWLGWSLIVAGFLICSFLTKDVVHAELGLLYCWLMFFAIAGLDKFIFPIIVEAKADQFADDLIYRHEELLARCFKIQKVSGTVGS